MKYLKYLFILLIALFLAVIIYFYHFYTSPAFQKPDTINVVIPSGASAKQISRQLENSGVISHALYFEFLIKATDATKFLKSGEYIFQAGETPMAILEKLQKGRVLMHQLTIPEGWTYAQFFTAVENDPDLTHTLAGKTPAEVMTALGHAGQDAEGAFFPSTYQFAKGASDHSILEDAYSQMQTIVTREWNAREPGLAYQTPEEAVIAASLIERETAWDEERPVIAGVILRRIKLGMPLQIDAAVIYGLGAAFTPPVTYADLKKPSPYNTYLNKGLPPTPICLPSAASIHAALHPVTGTYLYYVATGQGGHFFSSTYADQQAAVKRYRDSTS